MLSLKAKKRTIVGKKVKSLREKGLIPAVLYGPKIKNQLLVIDSKEFETIYAKNKKEPASIELVISGDKDLKEQKLSVLIKNTSIHPITDKIIHVDFYCSSINP